MRLPALGPGGLARRCVVHRIEAVARGRGTPARDPAPRGARRRERARRHALEARGGRRSSAASRGCCRAARRSPSAARLGRALGGGSTAATCAIAEDNLAPRLSRLGRRAPPRASPSASTGTSAGCCSTSSGWPRREREEILRHVDVTGAEHVEAARAAGRGALLVTAHIGNWELHGVAHGWLFGPIGVVARPLDNPALDARLCDFRRRPGNTVIYKQRALPQVLRLLRDNRAVAILIDQNVQERRRHLRGLLRPQGRHHHGGRRARPQDRVRAHPRPRRARRGRPVPRSSTSRRSRWPPAGDRAADIAAPDPAAHAASSRAGCGGGPSSGSGCTGGGRRSPRRAARDARRADRRARAELDRRRRALAPRGARPAAELPGRPHRGPGAALGGRAVRRGGRGGRGAAERGPPRRRGVAPRRVRRRGAPPELVRGRPRRLAGRHPRALGLRDRRPRPRC